MDTYYFCEICEEHWSGKPICPHCGEKEDIRRTMTPNLKKQILFILEKYPKARNSDQWLTIKLWCVYFPSRVHEEAGRKPEEVRKFIYLDDMMTLPREDNVKRIRAVIQNEKGKFLPTDWKVAKQRKINEEIWKSYIRNQTEYKRL